MANHTYTLSSYQRADLYDALRALAGAENYRDEDEASVKAAQRALAAIDNQDKAVR